MTAGIGPVIYTVKDLEQAKALFAAPLGTQPYADSPHDVGFRIGGHEVGLDPKGASQGMTGPVAFYEVEDICWRHVYLIPKLVIQATLIEHRR